MLVNAAQDRGIRDFIGAGWLCLWSRRCSCCGLHELLLSEKFLEVLVLTFKFVVFCHEGGLLLSQLAHLLLELLDLISFFSPWPDRGLSVLESLACFLILIRVLLVTEDTVLIVDHLVEVLLLFLCDVFVGCWLLPTVRIFFWLFSGCFLFADRPKELAFSPFHPRYTCQSSENIRRYLLLFH